MRMHPHLFVVCQIACHLPFHIAKLLLVTTNWHLKTSLHKGLNVVNPTISTKVTLSTLTSTKRRNPRPKIPCSLLFEHGILKKRALAVRTERTRCQPPHIKRKGDTQGPKSHNGDHVFEHGHTVPQPQGLRTRCQPPPHQTKRRHPRPKIPLFGDYVF
jgi:hypothetical protein